MKNLKIILLLVGVIFLVGNVGAESCMIGGGCHVYSTCESCSFWCDMGQESACTCYSSDDCTPDCDTDIGCAPSGTIPNSYQVEGYCSSYECHDCLAGYYWTGSACVETCETAGGVYCEDSTPSNAIDLGGGYCDANDFSVRCWKCADNYYWNGVKCVETCEHAGGDVCLNMECNLLDKYSISAGDDYCVAWSSGGYAPYCCACPEGYSWNADSFSCIKTYTCTKNSADLDQDGDVDKNDVNTFMNQYGNTGCSDIGWCACADINQDTNVGLPDFSIFASQYGIECAEDNQCGSGGICISGICCQTQGTCSVGGDCCDGYYCSQGNCCADGWVWDEIEWNPATESYGVCVGWNDCTPGIINCIKTNGLGWIAECVFGGTTCCDFYCGLAPGDDNYPCMKYAPRSECIEGY